MLILKTLLLLSTLCGVLPLLAADTTLTFDPPKTAIHWTLDTLLHTVHGTFLLKSGTVHFDPATGAASGALIVDARSGQSGGSARDSRMHSSILESAKFTEIVFRPDRVEGQIPTQGAGTIRVHGYFDLHGQTHELTLPMEITAGADEIAVKSHFQVAYLLWGLKNPSTFILKVNDKVDIELTASGHVVKGAQ